MSKQLIFDRVRDKSNFLDLYISYQRGERKKLIENISAILNCHILVLYQNPSVSLIDDNVVGKIEAVVHEEGNIEKPWLLILNSSGGYPLAAERLVRVIRSRANKGFRTLVFDKAKSAATLICLCSDRIFMMENAELGPIDPQISWGGNSVSVDSYLGAYKKLCDTLEKMNFASSNPAWALEQLRHFDPSVIEEMHKIQALGKDIAKKYLSKYMMNGQGQQIKKVIDSFSDSNAHKAHGRPIWPEEVINLGLNVDVITSRDSAWEAIYELRHRYEHYVELEQQYGHLVTSVVETAQHVYAMKSRQKD